jgi:hypothetical protein
VQKIGDNTGISEIIGTVLMLGMAIALFAGVSLVITSYQLSTPSPQVDIVGFVEGSDIIFEHHGGPSLLGDTQVGITINGTTSIITVEDYIVDINSNDRWDIGEQVVYSSDNLGQAQIDVMIIDYASNSVLMMATIQNGGEGGSFTPSLSTTVDSITPYMQISSPSSITTSGSSDLDDVSLYYRWSNDNWSSSPTTLTYDDFENSYGNYTDGGTDCSIYTGGTYAHQGTNAVNIQDNTGDDSSFYHTLGYDVDTSGITTITIDFWFYMRSFNTGHDFWIQYFDGTDWNIIATFECGDQYANDQFYHETVWINESEYTFPTNMKIKFTCDANNNNDDVYIDEIYVNASFSSSKWAMWINVNNPDTSPPWSWNFDFPFGLGYYEFYSIGSYDGSYESAPLSPDARCYYNP